MAPRWNDYDIMKFVNLYEGEPILWNTSNTEYKNKRARIAALERICRCMEMDGFGIDECKTKIKNIRTHYWQETTKIRESLAADSDKIYKPSVIWFEVVDSFLRRFTTHSNKKRPRRNSPDIIRINGLRIEDEEDDEDMVQIEDDDLSRNIDLDLPSTSAGPVGKRAKLPPLPPLPSREKLSPTSTCTLEAGKSDCKSSEKSKGNKAEKETEFDLWARSIAMQLNKMEPARALDLQLQMQTIITKERLQYETHKSMQNL